LVTITTTSPPLHRRWTRQSSWRSHTDGLFGPCETDHWDRIEAERVPQREAEEAAAREAAEAEAKKNRGLFRRR
jgi:predicted SnoaL-like aldol condensation-catalyzing enzyme